MDSNISLFASLLCLSVLLINYASTEPQSSTELQERKIGHLEGKLQAMESKVESLSNQLMEQRVMLNKNIAEQKLEKTMLSIIAGNQEDAKKFWSETVKHTEASDVKRTLEYLIVSTYANTRKYFYPIMDFIVNNELYSGFPIIYDELEKHGNLYGGGELFVFGKTLKHVCGTKSDLYKELPKIVQDIASGPVVIQHVENHGYLIAHDHEPCKVVSFYQCNEGYPKQDVFLHKIPHLEDDDEEEAILVDPRAQWTFSLPVELGLDLPSSSGLLMKNVHMDEFVIVKLRGASSFFLRKNTTFAPYFANDRQCQYLPELEVEKGDGEMIIGFREKYVNKTQYFYGGKFDKVTVIDLMQRSLVPEKTNFFWKVNPVSEPQASNEFTEPSGCTF